MNQYTAKCEVLASKSRFPYIGIKIPETVLEDHIKILQENVSRRAFVEMRENQSRRDRGSFHMTLIAPREGYETFDQSDFLNMQFNLSLIGVGHAKNETDEAFYVVVNCKEGDELRTNLSLKPRDFHITLGFRERDVHNVSKDETTLVPRNID